MKSMGRKSNKYRISVLQALVALGIIVFLILAASPIILLAEYDILDHETTYLLYYVVSMGSSFIVIYIIRAKVFDVEYIKIGPPKLLIVVLSILTTLFLTIGLITPLSSLIPMPEQIKELLLRKMDEVGSASFLMMAVLAPIIEELIFRAVILDGLLKRYNFVFAIFFSSFLFAVAHLNPWQFVTALILGCFFGWLYYKSKNILYPIIAHCSINLTGFLMRVYIIDDFKDSMELVELYGGLTRFIVIVALSIFLSAFSIYLIGRIYLKKWVNTCDEYDLF